MRFSSGGGKPGRQAVKEAVYQHPGRVGQNANNGRTLTLSCAACALRRTSAELGAGD